MSQESNFWACFRIGSKTNQKYIWLFCFRSSVNESWKFSSYCTLDSPVKQLFWDQNLADVIITAGFEIYNDQITVHYIFQEENDEVTQSTNTNHSVVKQSLPPVETGLKQNIHLIIFVQGDGNVWALSAALAVSENL